MVVVLIAGTVLGAGGPAAADFGNPAHRGPDRPLTFPVVGRVAFTDTFGAPRSGGRSHAGLDLMAGKMQPLVAAAAGTVTRMTVPEPTYGYMLTITGDDGWSYNYVHINNDTPGTDDGIAPLSAVFAPGLSEGARVVPGQLVAYVGDSGNAEDVAPQLHFELIDPTGEPVNPMASLTAAPRVQVPVDQPAVADPFDRLAGEDRTGTALAVSRAGWPDGSVEEVVVASGASYAEALPASVLAGKLGSPMLLWGGPGDQALHTELRRLGARAVVVVGSVPSSLDAELAALGLAVQRLGRPGDVVDTAAAIADRLGPAAGVVVANLSSFADGVTAASLATGNGWPILLTSTRVIPQASVDAWRRLGAPPVIALGGTTVVGDNVTRFFGATRLAGDDRYGTAVAAAEAAIRGGRALRELVVATGTAFPDALAAAPLSARKAGVTLLIDGDAAGGDDSVRDWLAARRGEVGEVHVLGGRGAITGAAAVALAAVLDR